LKKRKFFSAIKYVFFLGLGLVLLWYVTKGHDYNEFINEFKTANYYWIALAMFFGTLSHISRALRWNMLINAMGSKTRFSTTFFAVMIGYFANLLVPRLGEVSRCAVLHKNEKIPFNSLLGTVVAERIFDFFCLLFITFLVIYFQFEFLKSFIYNYIYAPLTLKFSANIIGLIIVGVVLIVLAIAGLFILKALLRQHNEKSFAYKIKRLIYGFAEGLKTIKNVPNKSVFLLHSVFIWMMYFLMTYLCFFSLSATSQLGIADGFTVLVMGSMGIVAPVPGGIGAYHFFVITTLVELFSINSTSATSLAYISHTSQTLLIILLGFFSIVALSLRKRRKGYDKI